jgi:hypothetical protein
MVLQLSHKKKEMVVPVRKKKEMVTHTLRVQLTSGKLMKNYSGGTKWRPMGSYNEGSTSFQSLQ